MKPYWVTKHKYQNNWSIIPDICRFARHQTHQGKYYSNKSCNGVSLSEVNYDAIKREIIPILQHSVSEDHTEHNGSLGRGYLDSKR